MYMDVCYKVLKAATLLSYMVHQHKCNTWLFWIKAAVWMSTWNTACPFGMDNAELSAKLERKLHNRKVKWILQMPNIFKVALNCTYRNACQVLLPAGLWWTQDYNGHKTIKDTPGRYLACGHHLPRTSFCSSTYLFKVFDGSLFWWRILRVTSTHLLKLLDKNSTMYIAV